MVDRPLLNFFTRDGVGRWGKKKIPRLGNPTLLQNRLIRQHTLAIYSQTRLSTLRTYFVAELCFKLPAHLVALLFSLYFLCLWQGQLMLVHKSTALIVTALLVPRVFLRLTAQLPKAVPGKMWEQVTAKITHSGLYVLMLGMPLTGILMGLLGGRGLPFFGLFNIPGVATPNKEVAGTAFRVHKWLGTALEVLVPMHLGGVVFHLLKGQNILRRMGLGANAVSRGGGLPPAAGTKAA